MVDGVQDAGWAVDRIRRALAVVRSGRIVLGGSRPPAPQPGELPVVVHPSARLVITLSGAYQRWLSCGGQRIAVDGATGTAVLLAPGAWDLRRTLAPYRAVGLVFAPGYLRVLEVVHAGGRRLPPAQRWHHTAGPLAGGGRQAVEALVLRAEAGCAPGQSEAHLVRAVLHLAMEHCLTQPAPARGAAAWQAMGEYLHEHAHEDLSRDGVARRFGLHPTYLSELCVLHGGAGFHRLLEAIRVERVHHRLLAGDEPVAVIANACGFRDVGTCIRAFRRRCGITPGALRRRNGAATLAPPSGR